MSGPALTVGRGVVAEVARLAALEVPDVLRVSRGGPPWLARLAGSPVGVRRHGDVVDLRLWVVARPGSDLPAAAAHVRSVVAAAVAQLLGLRVGTVTVVVDGVGG